MSFNRPHPSVAFQAFVFKFIDDLPYAEQMSATVYWQDKEALIVLPTRVIAIEDNEEHTSSVKNFEFDARWSTLDS